MTFEWHRGFASVKIKDITCGWRHGACRLYRALAWRICFADSGDAVAYCQTSLGLRRVTKRRSTYGRARPATSLAWHRVSQRRPFSGNATDRFFAPTTHSTFSAAAKQATYRYRCLQLSYSRIGSLALLSRFCLPKITTTHLNLLKLCRRYCWSLTWEYSVYFQNIYHWVNYYCIVSVIRHTPKKGEQAFVWYLVYFRCLCSNTGHHQPIIMCSLFRSWQVQLLTHIEKLVTLIKGDINI